MLSDNASNNAALVKTLEIFVKELCAKSEKQISELFNVDTCQLRCTAHSINLTVMEIIKAVAQGCTDRSYDNQSFSLDDSVAQDINADSNLDVDAEVYSILGNRNLYDSITKLREVLKLLKYSRKLQSLLKRELQDENEFRAIKLDVRTRWRNTESIMIHWME
jgi:hypothetical protein